MSKQVIKGLLFMGLIALAATTTVSIMRYNTIPAVFPPTAMLICLLLNTPHRLRYPALLGGTAAVAWGDMAGGLGTLYSWAYAGAGGLQALVVTLLLTRGLERDEVPALRNRRDLTRLVKILFVGAVVAGILGMVVDLWLLPQPRSVSLTFGFGISLVTNLLIVPLGLQRDQTPSRKVAAGALAVWGVAFLATFSLFSSRFTQQVTPLVAMQVFLLLASLATIALNISVDGERRATARALAQEVGVARLIESAEGTAFIAYDNKGVINLFSRGAERLLGYRADEVTGVKRPPLFAAPHEIANRARELGVEPGFAVFTRGVDMGASYETRDWTYVCKDGTERLVSASVTRVREPSGKAVGYLSILRDLTQWKELEEALRAALEREREANRAMREAVEVKTEFVSNVSHELRTPLTSIIGYLEVIDDEMVGPVTDEQRELLGRIERNSRRLLDLIQDLLTLGELDADAFSMTITLVDLGDVIEEVVTHAVLDRGEPSAEVDLSMPPNPVFVEADRDRVVRLLKDLLANALTFTPEHGAVRVTLESRHDSAVIRVQDTGPGISYEEQAHIFKRFYRTRQARRDEVQGVGLGLSIVEEIALAHGGTVCVESILAVGTTFTVTLPKTQRLNVTEPGEVTDSSTHANGQAAAALNGHAAALNGKESQLNGDAGRRASKVEQ